MTVPTLPPAPAREARRAVMRRRLWRSVLPAAILIPIAVIAAVRGISAVAPWVPMVVTLTLLVGLAVARPIYRSSRRERERSRREREAYLEELRAATPALTPTERAREMEAVELMGFDEAAKGEIRGFLESAPGGIRPLSNLRLRDPDAWFRAGRTLHLRALVLYPGAGLALGAAVAGIESLGLDLVAPLGIAVLFVPGVLTWRDDALEDAEPGERTAWSLAATFVLVTWVVATVLALGM